MNKKILIALIFSMLMFIGAFTVMAGNSDNSLAVHIAPATPTGKVSHRNMQIGASNSGLNVPLGDIGYSGANGSAVTISSFSGDGPISNNGSLYYISGNTLIVNSTTTLSNIFIGYGLEIKSGAVLTLGPGVILDELYNGNGYNNYTAGQLIIDGAKICGGSRNSYNSPIVAYLNKSLTYAGVEINVLGGNNDTFSYNTDLEVTGIISNSHFAYNNMSSNDYLNIQSENNKALIRNSYFQGVNGTLNSNSSMMNIQHSTISFMDSYVHHDIFGKTQLSEENVNLSYDRFIQYSGSQYDGLMLFDYSNMYNDYYNFTVPASDWDDTSVISNAESVQSYNTPASDECRGSTNLNNSLYPVHISHNEFAGWDGMELYGSGNSYIENNIITEQFFWTAYIDMFSQYNEPLKKFIAFE